MPYKKHLFLACMGCFLLTPTFAEQPQDLSKPPKFQLPIYKETPLDFTDSIAPLKLAPSIDSENIFKAVSTCYPSTSKFDISVKLQSGATLFDHSNSIDALTERGNYYVGIVAEMPLLDSSATLERQRQKEYDRRKETAAQVAKFISALSERNQAEREIGLYTALEKRAKARVQMGVTSVQEQITYLEKVIGAQQKITSSIAKATEAKLALEAHCQDNKKPPLSRYLRQVTARGGD